MKTKRKLNQRQDNVKGLMIDDSFSFFTTGRDYMGKRWPDNAADFLGLLSLNFFVSYLNWDDIQIVKKKCVFITFREFQGLK